MDVGIIGLGRMGGGVARRLRDAGNRVVAHNRTVEKAHEFAAEAGGGEAADTIAALVAALPAPRTVWLYLPAGEVVDEHIAELTPLLESGDVIIDGGNSNFHDSVRRAEEAAAKGLGFLDVGTSGGLAGATQGYCLMIGGPESDYSARIPLWEAVACAQGYALTGPSGAGHFTKMVHNAIEYGVMQSYAEGYSLLTEASFAGKIDLAATTEVWQHGSIITSFLGAKVAEAIKDPSLLESASSVVAHTGEGAWAVAEAEEKGVTVPAIKASLQARVESAAAPLSRNKLLSAVRYLFGGHSL